MKILFVENRYKTWFWEALSLEMIGQVRATEVTWLVQNPVFSPKLGKVRVVPFPSKKQLAPANPSAENKYIENSDRNINYYGGNNLHYEHYRREIYRILSDEMPDVVVGESTLFHELLVIEWCKKNDVKYLHPIMIGYPGGRFTIYRNDTKNYISRSDDVPTREHCLDVIDSIRKRERVPDYMQISNGQEVDRYYPLPGTFRDKLKVFLGYFSGEKYNTPSPFTKYYLDRKVRRNLIKWNKISEVRKGLEDGKYRVLYPMQLQPESNLDVWGQEYRNQERLILEISNKLPKNWILQVKLNPKVKYELSEKLLDVVEARSNIQPVHFDCGMDMVFPQSNLVCTVTGTVAVECVLSGKPLIQLGPGITDGFSGCVKLDSLDYIPKILCAVESGEYAFSSVDECIDLIKLLYSSTFPGQVSDPASKPSVLQRNNISIVAKNLISVVNSCE